jgi:hypothetical protein
VYGDLALKRYSKILKNERPIDPKKLKETSNE